MSEKQSTSNASQSSVTITVSNEETNPQDVSRVRLKLKKSKCIKKVGWSEETVDNEHLDKKKSKCCCIYKKPRAPEESSSSDSEDECEHCQGHVEKKKKTPKEQQSSTSDTNATSMIAA